MRNSRVLTAVCASAALALTLGACGGGSAALPAPGGSAGSSTAAGSSDAYQQILDAAPVATADQIPAGSLMATIKKRGTLAVGGTDTSALFSLKDPVTGRLTGFDAGLAAMLAKYITGSTDTKLVQVTVATREQLLRNGTVDTVFATYSITPERAKKIDFAGPYYSSGNAILTKKGDSGITSVKDLNGKNVCVQSGSTAANNVKKFAPKAQVMLFEGNSQCVQAVRQGRADAYVNDQSLLVGVQYRDLSVQVVGKPFTTDPYGIGVPKQSPEMKKFVDAWLKKIEDSGLWAKLWKATLGTAVTGDAPKPPVIGSVEGS
ncbi:glutamate ABC transporter substrate-binding protein [Streptomyces sp. NPDC051738]|uniref:glutamate ABC transporter substrate-binding protein n=1 Tax=Streptomyces sp. NPDC051738 TaxID=3365672 RepID=UPI0037D78465